MVMIPAETILMAEAEARDRAAAHQEKTPEQMDREANAFAFALLMPEEMVNREVERMGGIDIEDDVKLARLAKKFKVSLQVAALRLGQLSGRI